MRKHCVPPTLGPWPKSGMRRLLQIARGRRRSPVGLKRWFIPGTEFEGKGQRTAYANKELHRRRRAGKIARASRRRNHT